jgi:serine O-acetyltransferase
MREKQLMIKNRQDYEYYLEADRIALGRNKKLTMRERLIGLLIEPDYVWDFQKLLRKVEYLTNKECSVLDRINRVIQYRKFIRLSLKLGYYIHPNTFGPGLCIIHPGSIMINADVRIGSNCVIAPHALIGFETRFSKGASPKIGNNVYIAPGVRIFGSITIADNIAIGAGSVVTRSFTEEGITIAGVPAKKISEKGSLGIIKATELMNK